MRPGSTPNDRGTTAVGEAVLPEFEFPALPYAEFNRWIDEDLALLVARWEHLAAPRALRVSRISRVQL